MLFLSFFVVLKINRKVRNKVKTNKREKDNIKVRKVKFEFMISPTHNFLHMLFYQLCYFIHLK